MDYIERLDARRNRIERDFKFLKLFPELEPFRALLEQELLAQADFDKQNLDDIEVLAHELHEVNKRDSLNLALMRGKAERLWHERQQQIERVRLANQKKQEEEKRRELQEEEKRREQERLNAEQEQYARKKERIEQNRLRQECLHQEQQVRKLIRRQQQRQKFQQELSQKEYGLLLTLEEVKSRLSGLKAFYPPSHNGRDTFIQQIELLTIDCQRNLNSSFQQTNKRVWADILAELQNIRSSLS